jgi:hypothetical protein
LCSERSPIDPLRGHFNSLSLPWKSLLLSALLTVLEHDNQDGPPTAETHHRPGRRGRLAGARLVVQPLKEEALRAADGSGRRQKSTGSAGL